MGDLLELIEKFISQPGKITHEECRRLLEGLGYKDKKRPGSDTVFHKKGCLPICVPIPHKNKYVLSPYIRRIIRLLELEDYLESAKGNKTN